MDNFIKNGIGEWVSTHTQVEQVANNTWSIATTQIDAYGDTVYCFVEKNGNLYKIGDDSHILFKLDPGNFIFRLKKHPYD